MVSAQIKQRLIHGIGAQAFSQLVSLIVQLCTVPLFIHFWGKSLYGEWVLLTTIPSYFSLSDLGFASAAGNEMTMRMARNDKEGTLQVFQSAWVLVSLLSLGACLLALVVVSLLPVHTWLKLQTISLQDVRVLIPLLVFQVFFAMQRGLIGIGYRCDGNFAIGVLLMNVTRLLTFVVLALTVALVGTPIAAATSILLSEIACNLFFLQDIRRRSPWLQYGIRHADRETMRSLAGPAVSYMGFPVGNALSLQGFVMLVGVILGPTAVVSFTTLRTLTRFISQILLAITNTVWVELSTAFGTGDIPVARRLHRRACQSSLWVALVLCGILAIIGPLIYARWTHGEVEFDSPLFWLMLLVTICNSFWSGSYIVSVAANRHQVVALIYVTATAASLGLGVLLIHLLGIHGTAIALLLIDLIMIGFVVPRSLAMVEDNLADFVRAVTTPPIDLVSRLLRVFQRRSTA